MSVIFTQAFLPTQHVFLSLKRKQVFIQMAVTPVGPFCPFRSASSIHIEPRMEYLQTATPEFAMEMSRIQLDMQMGKVPDKEKMKQVAQSMDKAIDEWENLLTRLRLSSDFQTLEYAKLTQAHLEKHGQSTNVLASMMRWQSSCMKAFANGEIIPPPPSNVDMESLQRVQDSMTMSSESRVPSIYAMTAAEKITSTPFTGDEPAFQSDTVKLEYERLCRDHSKLIEMGSSYGSFDRSGKLMYLDEIEKIQERWDVFYARFSLLGQLSKTFIKQCDNFLASMGMNENDFKLLLKRAHDIMRQDANHL